MAHDLIDSKSRGQLEVVRDEEGTGMTVRGITRRGPLTRSGDCSSLVMSSLEQRAAHLGHVERAEHSSAFLVLDIK